MREQQTVWGGTCLHIDCYANSQDALQTQDYETTHSNCLVNPADDQRQ